MGEHEELQHVNCPLNGILESQIPGQDKEQEKNVKLINESNIVDWLCLRVPSLMVYIKWQETIQKSKNNVNNV